jgi:hypothetical protein
LTDVAALLLAACPGDFHREVAVAIQTVRLGFGMRVMAHSAGDLA